MGKKWFAALAAVLLGACMVCSAKTSVKERQRDIINGEVVTISVSYDDAGKSGILTDKQLEIAYFDLSRALRTFGSCCEEVKYIQNSKAPSFFEEKGLDSLYDVSKKYGTIQYNIEFERISRSSGFIICVGKDSTLYIRYAPDGN